MPELSRAEEATDSRNSDAKRKCCVNNSRNKGTSNDKKGEAARDKLAES